MKKNLLFIPLLALGSLSYGLTDEEIAQAYKEAQREQSYYRNISGAGSLIGGIGGFAAGARGARALAKKADIGAPGFAAGGGAVAGAALGSTIGSGIAKGLIAAYYARKYGVSQAVAQASLITKEPLGIPEVKEAFLNAENKNIAQLGAFVSNFLERNFGTNWKVTVSSIAESSSNLYASNKDSRLTSKIISHSDTGALFVDASWFLSVLSVLYFDQNFVYQNFDYISRLVKTMKLLTALNLTN